ncbi:Vitamin K epoxide reductase [Candidatus Saccharibacteria bacterium]|nr:MAG: Vitamin K epoxide reductase [Candidatus Saccharibacteria bacterium]
MSLIHQESTMSKTASTKKSPKKRSQAKASSSANNTLPTPQAHPEHMNWLTQHIPWILIGSGSLGLFASMMLSLEELEHLKNPTAQLGCDLNPIIGCGSILDTWQGHAILGVPNQFWGLAAFAVVVTIGFAILAGARLKRWFWLGLQIGLVFGLLFVLWFMWQSIFVLNHLCPYCMLTWVATLPAFWYTTLHCIRAEHLHLRGRLARTNRFAQKHHADILLSAYLIIVGVILVRFWYYWETLL